MRRLREPTIATGAWLTGIVVVVLGGTLMFPRDSLVLLLSVALAFALAVGWYVHMRMLDRSFRIEICLQPFGRLRL